jgi:serine phosphatase RsbU (regulator of sigma subunit)
MSLRTRLIVAFLLLSVVPLTAVTLYSYYTSVQTFQRAVERDASQAAGDISRRMTLVTDDVGRRVDRLFAMASEHPEDPEHARVDEIRARVAPMLGDAAALVDEVEFEPSSGDFDAAPPAPPRAPEPPMPPRGTGQPPPRPHGHGERRPPSIVVDVPGILAQTREALKSKGTIGPDPKMSAHIDEMVRNAVEAGMAGTEVGMKAATAAVAKAMPPADGSDGTPNPNVSVKLEGHDLAIPVHHNGRMVGHARAHLNMDRTLGAILSLARSDQGEIPFALDNSGRLYTPDPARRSTLESLHVERVAAADTPQRVEDWVVVSRRDPSGFTFGIARPLNESLRDIRRTSVRNLGFGLLVVALAIVGIVPISHRMTDRLRALTTGVHQLAAGDFGARVSVRSKDEFGTLATAFNQMAMDLQRNQTLAVEQERLRRELELSRQIQIDMLPRTSLRFGAAEIKGVSIPAREVGGDFFNYFELPSNRLGLLVGDVSGKGVSAALLMANVQATLRARLPLQPDLAVLADLLDRDLDETTPGSVFVTLFVAVLDDGGRELRYVNAGHNTQYVLRAQCCVERLASTGLPIGLYSGHGYKENRVRLEAGDLLFFFTDGLVEAENDQGEMFGAERLEAALEEEHLRGIDAVLGRLEGEVNAFRGRVEPMDDATMMALRV